VTTPAIRAAGLTRSFGETHALRGVDLEVPTSTVCAVLGRNGAGKTTAVRILTTLLLPDAGHAEVAGFDVVRDPARVRARIGVTGQSPTMDALLTGRQNLEIVGRMFHLPAALARARATELLERFGLADAAERLADTYSGGMRRRLDLAASLIADPAVLFLDEPTTGLDPVSRGEVWEAIRRLVADGTTVLLTTQYLDEADELADDIAVIDGGVVTARGTPARLRSQLGRPRVRIHLEDPALRAAVADALGPAADVRARTVTVPAPDGLRDLAEVVDRLREHDLAVADVALEHPSLDEVFAALTSASPAPAPAPEGALTAR
jgi:daunorubicin resistance ABC transporter ATP-binding subunit